MFGKCPPRLFATTLLFITTLLTSCADPKYVNPNNALGRNPEQKMSACQEKFASGYCVSYAWEKMPTETEFGSFLFKTFRPNLGDGSPIEVDLEGTHAVVLWMPSMGHGSSPVTVEQLDVGPIVHQKYFLR